jgi:pimeloyl-ACP methyl ester carboxylesterase
VIEAGSGPLALCLHGFPDCAHTWRHLLPALAESGFHAVAPFLRGYAPSAVPADGAYDLGALIADASALHDALGGTQDAVLIGHDWGAEVAYGAAALAPGRWRRLITLGVPPAALDPVLFSDFGQLKRFWYMFMFSQPRGSNRLLPRQRAHSRAACRRQVRTGAGGGRPEASPADPVPARRERRLRASRPGPRRWAGARSVLSGRGDRGRRPLSPSRTARSGR